MNHHSGIVALGVDTGGTYTDAVLMNHDTGRVLAWGKSLTTYQDLAVGVNRAVDAVLDQPEAPPAEAIKLVGLSTTLATNAIVEGRRARVGLILIGYDASMIQSFKLQDDLAAEDVIFLDGGHNFSGDEQTPLDEIGLRRAVRDRIGRVEAYAVSAYFGVRNPAHENRAAEIIAEECDAPVTCGHQLTTRLDSIRRAATAALNAGLVPIIKGLIETVVAILEQRNIQAQVMIVRGDGSLMEAGWAMDRPIETVLSGPAASLVGAWRLAGEDRGEELPGVWVVDVGGTTTDIGFLDRGRPTINREGASVGRWRTMVEAVDVRTVGLGGDSRVHWDNLGKMSLGPNRIIPLSLLAHDRPETIDLLRAQLKRRTWPDRAGLFLTSGREPDRPLKDWEKRLIERVNNRALPWYLLDEEARSARKLPPRLTGLINDRLVAVAGFTPTDALHALGRLDLWSAEAAKLGAEAAGRSIDLDGDEFSRRVVDLFSRRAAEELAAAALAQEGVEPNWSTQPTAGDLINRALGGENGRCRRISCRLGLADPVAAIGAPVEAYIPKAAELLDSPLILPPYAHVANAVGAVAGGVVVRHQVQIKPSEGGDSFRAHLPEAIMDYADLAEATAEAERIVSPWLKDRARRAGAGRISLQLDRIDHLVPVGGGGGESVFLGTDLNFTAVGRPSPAD